MMEKTLKMETKAKTPLVKTKTTLAKIPHSKTSKPFTKTTNLFTKTSLSSTISPKSNLKKQRIIFRSSDVLHKSSVSQKQPENRIATERNQIATYRFPPQTVGDTSYTNRKSKETEVEGNHRDIKFVESGINSGRPC
jgi:hypothetical protein